MVLGGEEKWCGVCSFLAGGGSVFAQLGGCTALGFWCRTSLPRATAEPSLLFLLALSGPLLAEVVIGLRHPDIRPCWERHPHHLPGCLRGNLAPTSFLSLEEAPPSCLLEPWLLLPSPEHHAGYMRARRNLKHRPLHLLSLPGAAITPWRSSEL